MPRIKYLKVENLTDEITDCPNIISTGSVKGMKDLYWGKDALVS